MHKLDQNHHSSTKLDQTLVIIEGIGSPLDFLRNKAKEFRRCYNGDFEISEDELTNLTEFLKSFFSTYRQLVRVESMSEKEQDFRRDIDKGLERLFALALNMQKDSGLDALTDRLTDLAFEIRNANAPERHQRGLRNSPHCTPNDEEEQLMLNGIYWSTREKSAEQPFQIKFVAQAARLLRYRHDNWAFFGLIFQHFYPKYSHCVAKTVGEILANRHNSNLKRFRT